MIFWGEVAYLSLVLRSLAGQDQHPCAQMHVPALMLRVQKIGLQSKIRRPPCSSIDVQSRSAVAQARNLLAYCWAPRQARRTRLTDPAPLCLFFSLWQGDQLAIPVQEGVRVATAVAGAAAVPLEHMMCYYCALLSLHGRLCACG